MIYIVHRGWIFSFRIRNAIFFKIPAIWRITFVFHNKPVSDTINISVVCEDSPDGTGRQTRIGTTLFIAAGLSPLVLDCVPLLLINPPRQLFQAIIGGPGRKHRQADKMFLVGRQVVTIEKHAMDRWAVSRRYARGRIAHFNIQSRTMQDKSGQPVLRTQDERTLAKRQDFSSSRISSSNDRDTKDTLFLLTGRCCSSDCKNRLKMARRWQEKPLDKKQPSSPSSLITATLRPLLSYHLRNWIFLQ